MYQNARELVAEEYKLHDDYIESFELEFRDHTLFYAGTWYGYTYETDDPDSDANEIEYTWRSFEEMFDCPIEALGMTWGEVLEATPTNEIDVDFGNPRFGIMGQGGEKHSMKQTALEAFLDEFGDARSWTRDWYGGSFTIRHNGFFFYYEGDFWAYVWREGDEDGTKREYAWKSVEEMLDFAVPEFGMTVREMLESHPGGDFRMIES